MLLKLSVLLLWNQVARKFGRFPVYVTEIHQEKEKSLETSPSFRKEGGVDWEIMKRKLTSTLKGVPKFLVPLGFFPLLTRVIFTTWDSLFSIQSALVLSIRRPSTLPHALPDPEWSPEYF